MKRFTLLPFAFLLCFIAGCSPKVTLLKGNSGIDALDRMAEYDTKTRTQPADIITSTYTIDQDLKISQAREFIQKYYQKVVLIQDVKIASKKAIEKGVIEVKGGFANASTGFTFLFHPERAKETKKLEKGKVVDFKGYVFSQSEGPYTLYGAMVVR